MSAVRVLRRLGVRVGFPEGQTCCGQALYNSGYVREARELALKTMEEFRSSDYVVVPSGSCSAMMKVFYLDMFEDEPEMLRNAVSLSHRVYEFSEFLVKVLGVEDAGVESTGTAVFHQGCHLLREMEVREEPRALLESVAGLELRELPNAETCCGLWAAAARSSGHTSRGEAGGQVCSVGIGATRSCRAT